MNRTEIIAKLKAIEPQLRARGVAALYLFGSYARDEARPDSDVDVFVDPADDDAFGLIPLFDSRAVVESTLPGTEIAYSTRGSIVPRYRPYIERDAIRVF
jgi:predicted nucleotidyltransferase